MKILQLLGGVIRQGGEEMFVLNCMKNFKDNRYHFDCLVVEDCQNDDFENFVKQQGGEIFELKTPLHATRFSNHVYRLVSDFFKKHHYDVVHIHSSSIAALALLAAAADRAGTPKVIVHSHSTGKADSFEHKIFRFLSSMSERKHVDVFCACSKEAAEWKFAPKYAEKAIIIKNGIDCDRFRFDSKKRIDIRTMYGVNDTSFVLGHVGRLCKIKNQIFLIKVYERVLKRIPDSYLFLVGDGEDKNMLTDMVKQKDLEGKVIFTGAVNNVQDYLSALDVFTFPSELEGLGIVAIEAQCSGLPVVSSKNVPKMINITDEVTFLNIEENEEEYCKWADKICSYVGYERKNNLEIVLKAGYDIKSTVEELKNIYNG